MQTATIRNKLVEFNETISTTASLQKKSRVPSSVSGVLCYPLSTFDNSEFRS